jgi:hypothetical protein
MCTMFCAMCPICLMLCAMCPYVWCSRCSVSCVQHGMCSVPGCSVPRCHMSGCPVWGIVFCGDGLPKPDFAAHVWEMQPSSAADLIEWSDFSLLGFMRTFKEFLGQVGRFLDFLCIHRVFEGLREFRWKCALNVGVRIEEVWVCARRVLSGFRRVLRGNRTGIEWESKGFRKILRSLSVSHFSTAPGSYWGSYCSSYVRGWWVISLCISLFQFALVLPRPPIYNFLQKLYRVRSLGFNAAFHFPLQSFFF